MVVKQLFGCLTCPVVGIGARQIESVSAVKCASIVQAGTAGCGCPVVWQ